MKNKSFVAAAGFTLVELLIVMAILGVLVTIGLASFTSSQARGRDTERKSDLKQLASALELFYSDYGQYPDAVGDVLSACPFDSVSTTGSSCTWGASEFRDSQNGNTKTTYFKVLPKDPVDNFSYLYRVDSTNQKFQLFSFLENTQDPNIIITSQQCGIKTCNFSITSPNTTPSEF